MAKMYKVIAKHPETGEVLPFKIKAFSKEDAKRKTRYLLYRSDEGIEPERRNYKITSVDEIS